jgi:hypothetical protein
MNYHKVYTRGEFDESTTREQLDIGNVEPAPTTQPISWTVQFPLYGKSSGSTKASFIGGKR